VDGEQLAAGVLQHAGQLEGVVQRRKQPDLAEHRHLQVLVQLTHYQKKKKRNYCYDYFVYHKIINRKIIIMNKE
jgi:hypothetical protein